MITSEKHSLASLMSRWPEPLSQQWPQWDAVQGQAAWGWEQLPVLSTAPAHQAVREGHCHVLGRPRVLIHAHRGVCTCEQVRVGECMCMTCFIFTGKKNPPRGRNVYGRALCAIQLSSPRCLPTRGVLQPLSWFSREDKNVCSLQWAPNIVPSPCHILRIGVGAQWPSLSCRHWILVRKRQGMARERGWSLPVGHGLSLCHIHGY